MQVFLPDSMTHSDIVYHTLVDQVRFPLKLRYTSNRQYISWRVLVNQSLDNRNQVDMVDSLMRLLIPLCYQMFLKRNYVVFLASSKFFNDLKVYIFKVFLTKKPQVELDTEIICKQYFSIFIQISYRTKNVNGRIHLSKILYKYEV